MFVEAYLTRRIPGQVTVITPFEAHSVSPTTLDIAGGDILTITGRGFPTTDPADDELEVKLSDGSICVIITVTSTQITCQMNPISAEGTFDVEVVLDGETRIPG